MAKKEEAAASTKKDEVGGASKKRGGGRTRDDIRAGDVKKSKGKGGGGGGGGRGLKTTAPQAGGGWAPGGQVDTQIREQFQGILSGKIKRWTPQMKELKKQKLFSSIMSRKEAEGRGLDQDLMARGVSRGGVMAEGRTRLRTQALQTYGEGINEMELQEAMAEYDDKMSALGMAQQWLNSRRTYEIGKEQIAAQREATAANISLGYARIKSSEKIARMSAGSAAAGLALSRERFEFSKQTYEESKISLPNGDRVPPSTFNSMMGFTMGGP